eukprot:EG_transcript_31730
MAKTVSVPKGKDVWERESEPDRCPDPDPDLDDGCPETDVDVATLGFAPPMASPLPRLGPLYPDLLTLRMSNAMGLTIKVKHTTGHLFLTASGKLKVVGYNFLFHNPAGSPVFGVRSDGLHTRDQYVWTLPTGQTLATCRKGYLQKRTSLHVHSGGDVQGSYVLKCKSTKVLGGQFMITTASGALLGCVKRELKKGVVSK